ncbi:glycoside hydrolase family 108 protein [Xanthobacteraceae bacterium Astr-EGSB]|uniref:glycoside hydrolase family 108 protein n=1 Tax=Astrobacterium formosum TaxID=3069710 RepID=UPI0027B28583|nr:glycoside hydrolase family 108 protein [Xanthobacteraceae bacterium Astr-EGSB]
MKANYNKALKRVLVYEGGYSNHPDDTGGPTNQGIIQRVYDGYRKSKGQPTRSVRLLTDAERNEIYRRQYADKIRFDALPAGVDIAVFDAAVNSGPSQSTKWLQRAVGVTADGDLGEATLAAVKAHPDHDALIADMCARRLGMMQNLRNWGTFGDGWSKRVANVVLTGQAWAIGSVGPQPIAVHEDGGDAKAVVSDVALPSVSAEAGVQTGLGGGAGVTAVQTAQAQLQPLVGTNKTIDLIFTLLTLASVVIAVGGAAWALYAGRQRRKAERAWSGEAVGDLSPYLSQARAAA